MLKAKKLFVYTKDGMINSYTYEKEYTGWCVESNDSLSIFLNSEIVAFYMPNVVEKVIIDFIKEGEESEK